MITASQSDSYGSLKNLGRAIGTFIRLGVEAKMLFDENSPSISIRSSFERFLIDHDIGDLRAAEISEQNESAVRDRLLEACDEWRRLGLRPPYGLALTDPGTIVTFRNKNQDELLGEDLCSADLLSRLHVIRKCNSKSFLGIAALFLRSINCSPIIVTDGKGDEGIDLVGQIQCGPFKSIVVFVQCKTHENDHVDGGTIRSEYAKFKGLPFTEKYRDYLRRVATFDNIDGRGSLFFVLTNQEFWFEARTAARKIGLVLRSGRQIAGLFEDQCVSTDTLSEVTKMDWKNFGGREVAEILQLRI